MGGALGSTPSAGLIKNVARHFILQPSAKTTGRLLSPALCTIMAGSRERYALHVHLRGPNSHLAIPRFRRQPNKLLSPYSEIVKVEKKTK